MNIFVVVQWVPKQKKVVQSIFAVGVACLASYLFLIFLNSWISGIAKVPKITWTFRGWPFE